MSSVLSLSSTAAVFSPSVKDRFLEKFPDLILTDSIGSSESGFNGIKMVAKGDTAMSAGGPTVTAGPNVVILNEELELIPPDSDEVGPHRAGRQHPAGLLQGPGEDGRHVRHRRRRQPLLGPGRLRPLGRCRARSRSWVGARSPSTPAARRSSPKRSNTRSRPTPRSTTASWSVGPTIAGVSGCAPSSSFVPTQRSSSTRSRTTPAPSSPATRCHASVHRVDEILRSPAGKPDYRWALAVAEDTVESVADREAKQSADREAEQSAERGPDLTTARRGSYRGKRLFDLAVVVLAAVPASVLGLIVVVAIRLTSPGPAVLSIPRVGHGAASCSAC